MFKKLDTLDKSQSDDFTQKIHQLILGIIFKGPMLKVWEQKETYLFPYVAKTKMITIIEEGLNKMHKINIQNGILAFCCAISGERFPYSKT